MNWLCLNIAKPICWHWIVAGTVSAMFTFSTWFEHFSSKFWPASYVTLQVKSGTLFDNVVITDDVEYVKQVAEETWDKQKDVRCFIFTPSFGLKE